jgi:hypothetical protein
MSKRRNFQRRGWWRGGLAIVAAAMPVMLTSCASTGSSTVAETQFDASSDFIIDAQMRGRPVRLKVDPGAPWFVLLNGSAAKSMRLVGTRSATLAIGPMRLKGKTRSEKLTFSGTEARRHVMWLKGDVVKGADGVINPAHLPWEFVKMRLKAPRPGEQQIELPMRFDKERGLYHEYSFGGQTILTRFTLADRLTTATGAAASVIAKRRNGIWKGDPFSYAVRYGVTRPVRRMVLGQPLSVNGFVLSKMAVRILDDRGDYRLPVQELPIVASEQDPGEDILVLGKQRKTFGAPHFWLMIGSEDLSRCSNISYNNRTRRLILSCALTDPNSV